MITDLLKNNPIFQKIREKSGLDDKKIVAVILVLLIVVIFLDFRFITGKQVQGIRSLGPKIAKLQKDTDSVKKDLARIKALKSKQAEPQISLAKARKIVSQEEIAYILQQVSEMANKNDVRIMQMKPSQEKGAQTEKLIPLLITLDLVCDYHHLGKFINDMENGQIFLAVQGMKISSQAQDILKQNVSLAVKTYVKK
jgi:Tfp pilus assembly protein PilO